MAFNADPDDMFPGISPTAAELVIPFTAIPQVTLAESEVGTGDSRKIMYGVLDRVAEWYSALPLADRPGKMSVIRSGPSTVNGVTSVTFTVSFDLDVADVDVADEEVV